jgi:hypothetical protein
MSSDRNDRNRLVLGILTILSKIRCKCKSSCCSIESELQPETIEPEPPITNMNEIEETFKERLSPIPEIKML